MLSGLTKDVHSLRPMAAREEHRSFEADLKDEHSLHQTKASKPDRPAAPWVLQAALRIKSTLRLSKAIALGVCCSSGRSTSVPGGGGGGGGGGGTSRMLFN